MDTELETYSSQLTSTIINVNVIGQLGIEQQQISIQDPISMKD